MEINQQLEAQFKVSINEIWEQIKELQEQKEVIKKNHKNIQREIHAIILALSNVNLKIVRFTGGINKESINIIAMPLNKAFKFISFKGYTSRGDGKNGKQLQEKASKLEIAIGLKIKARVSVNKYSLEANYGHYEDLQNTVLIDINF